MSIETAIWSPFWYELDQAIEVGIVSEFQFFRHPPTHVVNHDLPVFYHGDWRDEHLYYTVSKRILSIRHAQLGGIRKIDTRGLDYSFTLCDGRNMKVEAEETPGKVYEFPEVIVDWRIFVEMEPA